MDERLYSKFQKERGMYQFYFLSILINLLCSVLLIPEFFRPRFPTFASFIESAMGKEDRLFILGISSVAVGVFKLLSPVYGDVLFLGDLFPAMGNVGGGGIFLLRTFKGVNPEIPIVRLLNGLLTERKTLWGYGCLLAAIIHFFVPTIFFF